MFFASDNWAGAAPAIVDAIRAEATGYGAAYGESDLDRRVVRRFCEIFERDVAVFLVGTGSAANGLALSSVNRPGGVVFCHRDSHIVGDECGGVEFLTNGARLVTIEGDEGKIAPNALRAAMEGFSPGFVHSGQPMAVSITQQNEAGGIYLPAEVAAIAAAAGQRDLPLHMDGARFANALAWLDVTPAEATWKAGVDILSFGGTKNGCIGAEALVIFDPARAADLPYLRKRAGQLFSKSRFLAAQFDAYLREGLWLALAAQANAMADRLRAGLQDSTAARQAWPTHGNEIFAILQRKDAARLRRAGATFHDWKSAAVATADGDEVLVRLVTSFATTPDQVDRFLGLLADR